MCYRFFKLIAVTGLCFGGVAPTWGGEGLRHSLALYHSEFVLVNERLYAHLDAMRACTDEMDRFEAGNYALQSPACQNYNHLRSQEPGLTAHASAKLNEFEDWMYQARIPEDENLALGERNETAILLRIHEVTLDAATRQTYRVHEMQDQRYGRSGAYANRHSGYAKRYP